MARTLGCAVFEAHAVGSGFPDAVCWHRNLGLFLVEIKIPGGRVTEDQQKFHLMFPVTIWRTLTDVCETLGVFQP